MRTAGWAFSGLVLLTLVSQPLIAAPVNMPDPVLEAAVEAIIGDDGVPGTVEGTLLATLTQLGLSGLEPNLQGVTDLTGLEAATALEDLALFNSPVADWSPLTSLSNLRGLALLDCAVTDADVAILASAAFAGQLQSLALGSVSYTANLNTVTQTGLQTISSYFLNLGELILNQLGQSYDLTAISLLPIGSWNRIGQTLVLNGNTLAGLNVISNFTAARWIDLSDTGLSNADLAEITFSGMTSLEFLNLADNNLTDITPLRNLPANASNASIILDRNPLSQTAVCVDIPALQMNGFSVSLEGVEPCGPEITLELDGLGSLSQMPNTYRYAPGSTVTFSAAPSSGLGYAFTGWTWTGSRSGSSSNFYVTFELGDETDIFTLTAHFSNTVPGTRTLTLAVDSASTGSGSTLWAPGVYTLIPGQTFNLVALSDPGSYFGGWTVDITGSDSNTVYTPVMTMTMPDADTAITAFFGNTGSLLSLSVAGQGTTSPPPGVYPLTTTAELTISAYPSDGWSLLQWEDNITSTVISTDSDLNITMTADRNLTAVFVENYTLTMIRQGGADSLTIPASAEAPGITYRNFPPGAVVPIAATSRSTDWVFHSWAGDLPDGTDPYSPGILVDMDRDRTLTAVFAPADHVLSLSAQGEGTTVGSLEPPVGQYGYLDGETVTLRAFPPLNGGLAFIGWRDEITSDVLTTALDLTLTMTEDRQITALFATDPGAKNLIIQTSGSGSGQTTPLPGQYAILPGQIPHIQAQPDPGMYFGGWVVEADFGGGFQELYTQILQTLPDPVMPPYPTRLTARFETAGYRLTVLSPQGFGSVSLPLGPYDLATDTPVTIAATPETGWNFVRWEDGSGAPLSTANPYTFTMTADREIRAVFEKPTFVLTLICSGSGSTVPPSSPAPGTQHFFDAGVDVFITATPDAGQMFDGWTGDVPEDINPRQTAILVPMDRNRTITARFAPAEVSLTIQLAGTSNPVNLSPPPGEYGYHFGEVVSLIALPANGSPAAFVAWTGTQVSGEYILTFPITQNMTMIANYTDDPNQSQLLTVLPPEGPGSGHTFPLDTGVYRIITNSTLRFSANPDSGSFFNGWRGDLAGETQPREVPVRVSEPTTFGAAFALTGATLTLAIQGEGYIVPNIGTYALAAGYAMDLFAGRINDSWVFDSWRDLSDAIVSTDPQFTFTVGTADQTLTAVFAEDVTAPTIIACAPDTVTYPDSSCRWFLDDYRLLVSAVDDYGPISLVQSPPAGTEISSIQTVTITAKDQSLASPDAVCQFTVIPIPCQTPPPDFSVDQNGDLTIDVSELMRIIQFYNSGGYHCAADPGSTEDGLVPGPDPGSQSCTPSGADLDGDFALSLEELLRVIQFYNAGHYFFCGDLSPDHDSFCPGWPAIVRLAHAAPGMGFVDLCVTAGPLTSKVVVGLDLGDVSPYTEVPSGNLLLQLVPVAAECSASLLAQAEVSLSTTNPVTLVSSAEPTILVFPDDGTTPPAGTGKVRILHANWGLQPINVVAVNTATLAETALANGLAYGNGSAYWELPAADYELRLYDAESNDLLYSGLNLQVNDAGIYSVIAGGIGTFNFFPMLLTD